MRQLGRSTVAVLVSAVFAAVATLVPAGPASIGPASQAPIGPASQARSARGRRRGQPGVASALALARGTGAAMGKTVIDASDGPGFLVNRCNRPFGLEALRLFGVLQ